MRSQITRFSFLAFVFITFLTMAVSSVFPQVSEWSEPKALTCHNGLKASWLNKGYNEHVKKYEWAAKVINNYPTGSPPVTFKMYVKVGTEEKSWGRFTLAPGGSTHEATLFFSNASSMAVVRVEKTCFIPDSKAGCKPGCYAACDAPSGTPNQPQCEDTGSNTASSSEPQAYQGSLSSFTAASNELAKFLRQYLKPIQLTQKIGTFTHLLITESTTVELTNDVLTLKATIRRTSNGIHAREGTPVSMWDKRELEVLVPLRDIRRETLILNREAHYNTIYPVLYIASSPAICRSVSSWHSFPAPNRSEGCQGISFPLLTTPGADDLKNMIERVIAARAGVFSSEATKSSGAVAPPTNKPIVSSPPSPTISTPSSSPSRMNQSESVDGPAALWKDADKFSKEGNYQKAIEAYKKIVESDSNNAGAWSLLGVAYQNAKQYSEAITALQRAIELYPSFEKYYFLGTALEARGDLEEADYNYGKALASGTNEYQILVTAAKLKLNLKRFKEAIGLYERIVGHPYTNDRDWPIFVRLAEACFGDGQYQKAAENYRKVIEIKNKTGLADYSTLEQLGLIRSLIEAGDRKGAVAAYATLKRHRYFRDVRNEAAELQLRIQKMPEN